MNIIFIFSHLITALVTILIHASLKDLFNIHIAKMNRKIAFANGNQLNHCPGEQNIREIRLKLSDSIGKKIGPKMTEIS